MPIENPFKKLSKPQLYAVVIGGTAVTGYALYRHKKATGSWSPFATGTSTGTVSSAPSTSSSTVTDPATGITYSSSAVDPLTNETYAAEIAQYGSVASAEASVSSQYGLTQSGLSAQTYPTGYTSQTGNIGTTTTSGTNIYTSNSAWAQAVQAGLEDISGSSSYDGVDIGTTLGDYLTGTPLSAAQISLINTAIAEYGSPPIGNIQVIAAPSNTTGTTPTSTTPTSTTPTSTTPTSTTTTGAPKTSPPNIVISFTSKELEVSFGAVGGATKYGYLFNNGHTATTTALDGVFSSATVGNSGTVQVRAGNANGWGPYSAKKSFNFPA
jgi:hypothetical protein